MLQVRDLKNRPLGPVSFDVAAGEIVVLSGPSGSGKSLLLRSLADLDLHEGVVSLDGARQEEIPPPSWRRRVGLLPAECVWWDHRVGEAFAGAQEVHGLEDLGFSTDVLSWEIERLSTGESQRLGLLRLLALKPRILLLDEPSANLDEENTLRVEGLIHRYREEEGAGVLWVSHDKAQQERLGARVLRIDEGRLQP